MYNLTFEFNLEKLIQAIAYFSNSGIQDLTKLKVAKLLYFADKHNLLEFGLPIIGDVYFCLDYGPVPSFSLNEMNAAISGSEIPIGGEDSDARRFSRALSVKKGFFRNYPKFEHKPEGYKPEIFSDNEKSSLRYTAHMYGGKSAQQLVELTHQEPTWRIANQDRVVGKGKLITYDLFFEGASEKSKRFLAKLVAEQYGIAIPLAGDADYVSFNNDLAAFDFAPDEIPESDVRKSKARFIKA
jgi:uncharacterized phage-associated protein